MIEFLNLHYRGTNITFLHIIITMICVAVIGIVYSLKEAKKPVVYVAKPYYRDQSLHRKVTLSPFAYFVVFFFAILLGIHEGITSIIASHQERR